MSREILCRSRRRLSAARVRAHILIVLMIVAGLASPLTGFSTVPASAVQGGLGAATTQGLAPRAVPLPSAGQAVVNVKVGADRVAGTAIAATGASGVTLRLGPTAGNVTAWASYSWASCTSDAQGDCNFQIPIKTSGSTDAGGMLAGAQPWVMQTSAPAGFRLVAQVRIAGDSVVDYRFRIAQTLTAGSTYSSTNSAFDFMITSTSASNDTTSAGTWAVARTNPAMSPRCGLRYAVLMDLSSSISSSELAQAKGAVNTFIDALVGTPSSVALFNFDETSPSSSTYPNVPGLRPVRTAAEANLVKQTYANWDTGSGTNWDAGFYAVATAAPQYDVVVVITDGHPTVYGSVTPAPGNGSNRLRDVEAGIFSANLVKSEGVRVVAVGVGPDVATGVSALNLAAISGPTAGSDYFQTGTYSAAASALSALAKGNCEATVSVTKRVIPSTATIPANPTKSQLDSLSTPSGGWQINASGTSGSAIFGSPTAPWITDAATGAATVPVRFTAPGTTGSVTWTESQKAGYTLQPVTSGGLTRNAVCVNAGTQSPVTVTDAAAGAATPGVSVPVTVNAAIDCTIYNRQLPASVTVTKKWIVNGVPYANGSQPAGLSAQLSLTGPGSASATPQAWGVPRGGYAQGAAVTVSEAVSFGGLSGCRTTSSLLTTINGQQVNIPLGLAGYTIAPGATPSPADPTVVTAEVTNTVACEQKLSLVKRVSSGSAPTSSWTLSAAGPLGSLTGPSGAFSSDSLVSASVTAGVPYTLTESGGSPLYRQAAPWSCALASDPSTAIAVTSNQVVTPLGRDVVCTVTNATAFITLVKTVTGGPATPDRWKLTATPSSMNGLTAATVTGAGFVSVGQPNSTIEVRPGHPYVLSEAPSDPSAPVSYRQARLEVRQADGTWTPAPSMTITAPAAGETAVYRFVNEPLPALHLPLTGGAASDLFVISGASLLALTVLLALGLRARTRARRR